jgi:endonuclease/exonuclease/phosphatase (EEP) superfamily protein YafD
MLNAATYRHLARALMLAWALASVIVAAASWLAAALPPLDLLNQVAPFWLLLALVGLAATRLALSDRRERVFISVAFALTATGHLALIAPELLRSTAVSPYSEAAPRVRIVWLNTQSGSSPEGVTEYLANSGADFLLLAEYHPEGNTIPEGIRAAYPHLAACLEPHDCNVVILSRRAPLAQRPTYAQSATGLRMVWADFSIDGAPLRLVGTHLHRPYPARRYAERRNELLEFIADSEDNMILAGDFNAAPWSFALRHFDERSGLTRDDRAMPTWPAAAWTRLRLPAPIAFLPIDHIYSGGGWRLVSINRGPRTGADHYPIEAEFAWSPER